MIAIDVPNARRLALGVVLGQAAVTVIAALLGWAIGGQLTAVSALVGGGISTAASPRDGCLELRSSAAADPQRAIRAFYVGEAVKLALVVVLFVVVLKLMKVAPLALFAAFMATFFVYWVALANALPPLGGTRAPRGR